MIVVLATQNLDKVKEFSQLVGKENWLQLEPAPSEYDVEETGKTFLENAELKAKTAAKLSGKVAIADDSGLSVEALSGEPGIYSARYCEGTDADRRKKLLAVMANIPQELRQAAFVCAMAVADPTGKIMFSTEGRWKGTIAFTEKGENGFGYDSLFYPKDSPITSAEMAADEKNRQSHRYQALKQVLDFLKQIAV